MSTDIFLVLSSHYFIKMAMISSIFIYLISYFAVIAQLNYHGTPIKRTPLISFHFLGSLRDVIQHAVLWLETAVQLFLLNPVLQAQRCSQRAVFNLSSFCFTVSQLTLLSLICFSAHFFHFPLNNWLKVAKSFQLYRSKFIFSFNDCFWCCRRTIT